jgi:hypothetical protein
LKLNEKHVEVIARTVLEYLEQEKEKQEKAKYDRRLRNIKMLLRNYRSLVKHCEGIKIEIKKLDEKLALDLLDTDEFAIEAIKASKKRTLATVRFVARMVSVYGKMSEDESEEAIRRYQTVYHLYISDKRKTAKEIATCHNVDERTVYRDVNNSLEPLSVLMFGIDGLKLK